MTQQDLNPNDYTVKEILTQFVMPAIEDLKQDAQKKEDETNARLSAIEAWKNRAVGVALIFAAVVIPAAVVPAVNTLVVTYF